MEELPKEVENCNGDSAFCACVHAKTLIPLISIWIYCPTYEAQACLLGLGPLPFNTLIPIS